jgi:hypothetical protein
MRSLTMIKTDHVDIAHDRFRELIQTVPSFEETVRSEADTRLKLIDPILMEVLGWQKSDIATEEQAGKGFLDYRLCVDGIPRVVLEAKRAARRFEVEKRECGAALKISGPSLKNADLQEGIRQAIEYSAYKGAELAVVTNGYEWIVFRSARVAEGTDTLEGKAFLFNSLACIDDSFAMFYDLLGKERITRLTFRALFQEAEGKIIRHPAFAKVVRPDSTASLQPQPSIAPELDRIMTSFFQRLSDDRDREMIKLCFVETKESRAAEHRLLRLAEELVGHIRALDTRSGEQLTDLITRAQTAGLNQFILIVGTKGAGKSTFVELFFADKLPKGLREQCVPIIVNLADSEGDERTIISWLRKKLLETAEEALSGTTPTWDELIGHMFFLEYLRWSKGTMSHLYQSNKEQFKVEFGRHIEGIRQNDPVEYLRGLLRNLVASRKQLPCLVFDNADHFSIEFQEKVFQFARSIFEQALCVVILPVTDKTSWQLSRQGALQSFENEALLLPTPSPKHVLEKRIEFVLKRMEEDSSRERGEYFVGKGIGVQMADLVKFVRVLQSVFLNTEKTAYRLGQLANHNIREVLELARNVVNSPYVGLDELFKVYVLQSAISIPEYRITKALIRGRYDIFNASSSKYLHNIFDLAPELPTTPLLGLRILQFLKDGAVHRGDTQTRYIEKELVYAYFMAMGVERRAISMWLESLLRKALVLSYDPTRVSEVDAEKLEISPSGELHLFFALGNYEYIEAMSEVTVVRDEIQYRKIEQSSWMSPGWQRQHDMISAFVDYLRSEDSLYCQIPNHEAYGGQKHLARIRIPGAR